MATGGGGIFAAATVGGATTGAADAGAASIAFEIGMAEECIRPDPISTATATSETKPATT